MKPSRDSHHLHFDFCGDAMTPTPNLVPCKGCGRMPRVFSAYDVALGANRQTIFCGHCGPPSQVIETSEEWNAAQQPIPRNDIESQQLDALRLAALLREASELVERMAGRL